MSLPYELVVKSEILSTWWRLSLWLKHHNTFKVSQLYLNRLTILCKQRWWGRRQCSRQHKIGHKGTKYIVLAVCDIDWYTVIHIIRCNTVICGKSTTVCNTLVLEVRDIADSSVLVNEKYEDAHHHHHDQQ